MVSTQQYNDKSWRSSLGRGQHYCSFEMFLSFPTAQTLTLTPPLLLDNQLALTKVGKKKLRKPIKWHQCSRITTEKGQPLNLVELENDRNFYKVFARLNMPLYSKFSNWGKHVLVTWRLWIILIKQLLNSLFEWSEEWCRILQIILSINNC